MLAEFDWSFNPKLPRQACFQLHTLKFTAAGENALLIGKPGTGKSHIAKATAYRAVLQITRSSTSRPMTSPTLHPQPRRSA
ncbi:hypothetical protein CI41S_66450 [Bradyrhizobium ivorense]|nr:hypothetical protein CI41S_66450 [Bradyrhizobium ivorense]